MRHKTAISRKTPSLPAKWLADKGLLGGRALDYGCGRGFDAHHYGMESFDPYYKPDMPVGRFDTILCTYVLNVIESAQEREQVLTDIKRRLRKGGIAYVTVRNDKKALKGKTSKGTWQGMIVLDLPIVRKCSGYVVYKIEKGIEQ